MLRALATAAAIWSPAQTLGAPAVNTGDPGVLFARDGTALITASFAATPALPRGRARIVVRRPDGTIALTRTLPDDLPAPPAAYGRDRVALLRRHERSVSRSALAQRVRLSVTRGTVAAPTAGKAIRVADFRAMPESRPALAAGPDGELAVAWSALAHPDEGASVRIAIARPGRPFGRPRTLATDIRDTSGVVSVAYGRAHELVIAYATAKGRRRVMAVTTRTTDGTFSRPQVLGPREGADSLALVAGADGHAIVAWGTQDLGETSKPWVVRAAARRGQRFGAAQVLDTGGRIEVDVPRRIALDLAPGGAATVAWSNAVADTFPLRVATSDRSGRFGPAAELDARGSVGNLARRADGTTLLTWTSFAGATLVRAAFRPAGAAAFLAPETVADADQVATDPPRAAFDPSTGEPGIAWPVLLNPPMSALHFALRSVPAQASGLGPRRLGGMPCRGEQTRAGSCG